MQSFLRLLILIATLHPLIGLYGQDEKSIPKNFVNITGGIEWNTLSGLTGVEYERVVFTAGKMQIGIKGNYSPRYKRGNFQLFNEGCCEFSSFGTVMGSITYFPSERNKGSGFFLHSGLGAGLRQNEYSEVKHDKVFPGFEAGLGWMPGLGSIRFRLEGSLQFASEGGITQLKVGMGF